jgi:aryl-alcohol dehydrogenase-like predicted oxidoreductase
MKTVTFGNTGLEVSEIGLGMAALGRPGYINLGHGNDLKHNYDVEVMQAHAHHVLSEAYQLGVRYFDSARSYGKAEQFLQHWLRDHSVPELVCGSKWGYTYTANWSIAAEVHEVKEHSIDVLHRQWRESRDTLADHLNIYHIHSATLDSGVLTNREVIKRLWELKEIGIVMGLSLSGTVQEETLKKALTITSEGQQLFGSVQVTWNCLEQSMNETLLRTFDLGVGIIVKESLANGRLTTRNRELDFESKKSTLLDMAKSYGLTIDGLAIAYVLQQSWSSVVLSGAGNKEQLLSNLKATEVKIERSDMFRLAALSESSDVYWATRSNLQWN